MNTNLIEKIIPFEVHITGEHSILEELDKLNIKNITVELLNKQGNVIREEYMSSFIKKCKYEEIHLFVQNLTSIINSKIIRIKIECPPIPELFNMSLYMESHFKPIMTVYPISRNKISQKLMATTREYNKVRYSEFVNAWSNHTDDTEVELCIFDSFKEEDFDWFDCFK